MILSDINVPGMDGVELLREIKRRRPDLAEPKMRAYRAAEKSGQQDRAQHGGSRNGEKNRADQHDDAERVRKVVGKSGRGARPSTHSYIFNVCCALADQVNCSCARR